MIGVIVKLKNIHMVLLTLVVLVGGGVLIYVQTRPEGSVSSRTSTTAIKNFDECVLAGNPIMESSPRQCRSTAGNLFVEDVDETTTESVEYVSRRGTKITLTEPNSGAVLKSPVVVKGTVPGSWSFEASFPVTILDSTGITIAQTTAKLNGDWMTDAYVPFEATLTFDTPVGGGNGTLILKKDNPSDLAENNDSVLIPISF
jgi:hypothetical protein